MCWLSKTITTVLLSFFCYIFITIHTRSSIPFIISAYPPHLNYPSHHLLCPYLLPLYYHCHFKYHEFSHTLPPHWYYVFVSSMVITRSSYRIANPPSYLYLSLYDFIARTFYVNIQPPTSPFPPGSWYWHACWSHIKSHDPSPRFGRLLVSEQRISDCIILNTIPFPLLNPPPPCHWWNRRWS